MVVGASSGIGRATAVLLSKLGAELLLVSRNVEKLERLKSEIDVEGKHRCMPFDVTDFDHYSELFDEAVSDGKKLDGLVYCAGTAKPVPLRVITLSEYSRLFAVNYYGFICMTQHYAKRKYNEGGSIVGVSAMNAHHPQKCMTLYASSKEAIEASVRSLALELTAHGIRINSVIPGAVDTKMSKSVDETTLNSIVERQLLGIQKPDDIANVIVFLLSGRSNAITGRNLYVDGGMLGQ